jgi:hypothetical protein
MYTEPEKFGKEVMRDNNIPKYYENLIAKRWNHRFRNVLPQKMKEIETYLPDENLIQFNRRRSIVVKEGDVFIIQPVVGIFYYGRVVEASVKNIFHPDDKTGWFSGNHVVFIFKDKSYSESITDFEFNYDNLIIMGPIIVGSDFWRRGYFKTIANIPLSEEEKNLDYGFYEWGDVSKIGFFVKANSHPIDHFPKYFSTFGHKSYTGIYDAIKRETALDDTLLKKENE